MLPEGEHPVRDGRPQTLPVGVYPGAAGGRRGRKRGAGVPLPDAVIAEFHAMEEKGSDVNLAAAGTDMMAPDLDSAELFVDRLNETLSIDRAEWSALAARAFVAGSEPANGD